jgi:2,4-dienoyl-CoA reductase-like NADH-dependent reductase (Old Yellow Enzyme family)
MADFVEGESAPALQSLDELTRRFDRGDFDLAAIGRVVLNDPNWLQKVQEGRVEELQPYSRENMDKLY